MLNNNLNTYKNVLFDRPSIDSKYLASLCVSEIKSRKDQASYQLKWFEDRSILSFGELLSAYIDLNKLTLREFSQQIQVELDELYTILDDEILPWELDSSLHQRILAVCDFKKELFINTIREQKLDYDNYLLGTRNMSVAARADADLDEDERKEALSNSKKKLFADRAERKKKNFLIQYQLL
ncbi:hypothetical protein HGO21_09510 [Acinetobacter sp. CUI P1]|nr:hypothetical protein [Acinetobacter sp. CUI P1]